MAKSATGLAGFKKNRLPQLYNNPSNQSDQFSKSVANAFRLDQ